MGHTDIKSGLIARLPPVLRPYALLSRWDRPIGTWLLLLPCWWGLFLATQVPPVSLVLLFAVGAVVMRGAGCTLNDILDRDLDAQVERTRGRPLPSGAVTVQQASGWLVLQLALGLGVLLCLNGLAIMLGVASLVLVAIYPLMKRVIWWPQAVLGLTFNWGCLMGFAAVDGALAPAALWLYAAGLCWTLVYDTIYAHQDKADDALIGVKSTARLFGTRSKPVLAGFASMMLVALWLCGTAAGLGMGFYLGLLLVAAQLSWQIMTWRPNDPASCLRKFRSNRDTGALVLLAIIFGRFV